MKKFQIREYIKKRPDIYKVIKIPEEITKKFQNFITEQFHQYLWKSPTGHWLVGYWDDSFYVNPGQFIIYKNENETLNVLDKDELEEFYKEYDNEMD